MAKFHINPETGNPGTCRAAEGKCPFGADAPHFASKEEARRNFEQRQGGSFVSGTSGLPDYAQRVLNNPPEVPLEQGATSAKIVDSWGEELDLPYGVYSDDARGMLLSEQSLGMAIELARAFRTDRVAVQHITRDSDELEWDEEKNDFALDEYGEEIFQKFESPYHVFAVAPDGSYWDASGRVPRELIEDIPGGSVDEYSTSEALSLYSRYLPKQNFTYAQSLVGEVVKHESLKKPYISQTPRPQRLYHFTQDSTYRAVMTEGLEPRIGANSEDLGEAESRVYFFPSREDAIEALGGWYGELYEDSDESLVLLSTPARVVEDLTPTFEDPDGSWEWSTTKRVPGRLLSVEGEFE